VLKETAEDVVDFNDQLEQLVQDMSDTMYHAPGVGLAANQIGVARRILVADITTKEEALNTLVMINPVIVETSKETEKMEEGCLSVPDFTSEVERCLKIKALAKDLKGEDIEVEAEGFLARVLQHEIDHLNGTLYIYRISRLKRNRYIKQRKKELNYPD
jgi:peptide deformylase